MSEEEHPMLRPGGHRYRVAYAVLGLVVVVVAFLIATGAVPI
jgi:hypothetical protein